MENNKVQTSDGTVIMDISDTTAEAADVAAGEVFYTRSGDRSVGIGNYMDKVSSPTANDILVTDANGQAVDSGVQLSAKQDILVSGTNIKTINGISMLGSGDIDIAFTAIYGVTTYTELIAALNADKAVLVKDIPYNGDNITVLVNSWKVTGATIEIDSIATAQGDLCDVYLAVTSADVWSETFVNRDPFMLLDFNQTMNVAIPYCTENISNTQIPNVDVAITDEMGADWAIASLAKYEVVDSSNARINCWPVCSFSMNGQKTLRLRMMCAGTSRKTATKISGAILLKHR